MLTVAVITVATLLSPPQDGFLLRLNMPQGAVYRLASVTTTDQSGSGIKMNMKSSMTMSVKVAKKTKDSITTTSTFESIKMTMNGGSSMDAVGEQLKNMRFEATYDTRGKVLRSNVTGVTGMMATIAKGIQSANFGFLGITYPVGRVKLGTIWKQNYSLDDMMKAMLPTVKSDKSNNVAGTYKITKITPLPGKTLMTISLIIAGKGTFDLGSQGKSTISMNSTGTMVVNAATGMLESVTMKGKNVSSGSMSYTQNTVMTMRTVR